MDKSSINKKGRGIADSIDKLGDSNTRALDRIRSAAKPSWISRPIFLASIFTIADVLIVSHFQPPTAIALLRYTPPLTLLLGAFVNIVPVLLQPVLVVLVCLVFWNLLGDRGSAAVGYFVFALFLYVVAATLLPSQSLPSQSRMAVLIILGGALFAAHQNAGSVLKSVQRLFYRFPSDVVKWASKVVFGVGLFSWFAVCLGVVGEGFSEVWRSSVQQPYVPAELIDVAGEPQPVVGYVIDVDNSGQWTTILIESDRTVRIFPSEDILRREVCATGGLARYRPQFTTFIDDAEPDSGAYSECFREEQ